MTSNQIRNREQKATERLRSQELAETRRSNLAKEAETARHNQKTEKIALGTGIANSVTGVLGAAGKLAGAANDPSWYNLDKQLVADAASLSYNTPLGIKVREGSTIRIADVGDLPALENIFPGVMRISYVHTVGPIEADTGVATMMTTAAKAIYAYVRHANSGSANYEAPDLLFYIIAVDDVLTALCCGMRAYSLALTAKTENRYYGNAMLTAAGFDPESVVHNLANFRARLNVLIEKARSLNIPADMPLMNRHAWMALNIFKDYPVKKSQEYMFVPYGLHVYNDEAGALTYLSMFPATGGGVITAEQYFTNVGQMLDALLASEDIGIMSGDILKAYGDNLWKLDKIPADFHIESTFSNEVLTQIAGTVALGGISDTSIGQDTFGNVVVGKLNTTTGIVTGPGRILSENTIQVGGVDRTYVEVRDRIRLEMYKDDVSPDDNMVATRLSMLTDTVGGIPELTMKISATIVGTEYVANYTIFQLTDQGAVDHTVYESNLIYANNWPINTLEPIWKREKFDWAPQLRLVLLEDNSSGITGLTIDLSDSSNYVTIDKSTLENMHNVATLSLFGVPKISAAGKRLR